MRKVFLLFLLLLGVAPFVLAEPLGYPKAKVNFDDFKNLVDRVEEHRSSRLIDLDTFLAMSKEEGVVVLDSRSQFRYDRVHVKGAKHLNFSDFSQSNLAAVIPSLETKILIYCNNNFDGNQVDFQSKVVQIPTPVSLQIAQQERPLMLALNVPTYINLFGYGYRNVYELNELVDVNDLRIQFEGSIVDSIVDRQDAVRSLPRVELQTTPQGVKPSN